MSFLQFQTVLWGERSDKVRKKIKGTRLYFGKEDTKADRERKGQEQH